MELSEKAGALGKQVHKQALITVIWKETKRTEKVEEAVHRSPMWAVLRAPQQGSIMSTTAVVPRKLKKKQVCLPFLSFSRQDEEIYWGDQKGPTAVI